MNLKRKKRKHHEWNSPLNFYFSPTTAFLSSSWKRNLQKQETVIKWIKQKMRWNYDVKTAIFYK